MSEKREQFEKKKQILRNQVKYGGTGVPVTVVNPDGTENTYAPGSEGYANVFKTGGLRDQVVGNSNAVVQTTSTNNAQKTQTRVVDENPSKVNVKDGQAAYGSVKVDGKALMAQMKAENEASELNNVIRKAIEDQADRGVTGKEEVSKDQLNRVVEVDKTPAPTNLSDLQKKVATELIQANPQDTKSQENIKELKNTFQELKNIKPKPYDQLTSKEKKKRNDLVKSISECSKIDSITTGRVMLLADPCKDTTFDQMQAHLENFFSKITGPGNAVLNMSNEIKNISNIMSSTMNGFVGKMTGALNDKLQTTISSGMSALSTAIFSKVGAGYPYSAALREVTAIQEGLMGPVSNLVDGVFCVGSKIKDAMGGMIKDLISAAIPNITNPVPCAVQEIIGAINNKVINMIDSVTGPLLGPITGVLGFSFDAKSFLSGGINILGKIGSLASCAPPQKCPASNKYVIGKGNKKSSSGTKIKKNFDKIFSGTALTQAAADKATAFEKEYGSWEVFGSPLKDAGNIGSGIGPCYTGNPLKCGGPKIEIFGGGGVGAAGKVILGKFINKFDQDDLFGEIQRTASIVGVEITNPGGGYTEDPIVTFDDNCNQGKGAYARAHVDHNPNSPNYGQVTSITMITPGSNYPAEDEETPLFIEKVIIENPGSGYKKTDTLNNFDLNIDNGQVLSGTLVEQVAYDDLPKLNIDSETGVGAILKPIMSKTRPQGRLVEVIDCVR